MRKALLMAAAGLFWISLAQAQTQTDILIEVDTGRTQGVFDKSPVLMRAILAKPAKPTDTALLYFRGYPGIAKIQSVADKERNLQPFMRKNQRIFEEEGIALVVMDCPTDQWATCDDRYRSSKEHADDVRRIIAKLKEEHGLTKIYIMGHSLGTISSRWLAKYLGNEIAGSIHSSSMNGYNKMGYANSLNGFDYSSITAPTLHIHNEHDGCQHTPYRTVKGYAGDNLVTVRGGIAEGDPCGAGNLHSHQGREEVVVREIVSWIKTGKVDRVIGE